MIYRDGGGLSFGLGVVVVFLGFLELGENNNGGKRERASSFVQQPSPLFIEFFRIREDTVRTGRISDFYNPQS